MLKLGADLLNLTESFLAVHQSDRRQSWRISLGKSRKRRRETRLGFAKASFLPHQPTHFHSQTLLYWDWPHFSN